MDTQTLQDQVLDMWRTRPVRLPGQGRIAGVCAGIAARYRVDPALVRVAFVVATLFGGAGVVLYIAAWILLPTYETPGQPPRRPGAGKLILLLIVLALTFSAVVPSRGFGGSLGFVSTLLLLCGWWLLYRRTPQAPTPVVGPGVPGYQPVEWYTPTAPYRTQAAAGPIADPSAASGTRDTVDLTKSTGAEPTDPTAPPAWDPLGVAPFAWDLPEPRTTPTPPAPRERNRFTSIVLGLALLAGAATAGIAITTDIAWFTPARIGAVALAVIGLGMIVGALLRRGYGLMVAAFPLIGFVVLASLPVQFDGPREFRDDNAGVDQVWTPLTTDALQAEYSSNFADSTLDLRRLDLTEDRSVAIDNSFGRTIVIVPADMNVDARCDSSFGSVRGLCETPGVDGGADGTDGPTLTLNVDSSFGDVVVDRG